MLSTVNKSGVSFLNPSPIVMDTFHQLLDEFFAGTGKSTTGLFSMRSSIGILHIKTVPPTRSGSDSPLATVSSQSGRDPGYQDEPELLSNLRNLVQDRTAIAIPHRFAHQSPAVRFSWSVIRTMKGTARSHMVPAGRAPAVQNLEWLFRTKSDNGSVRACCASG